MRQVAVVGPAEARDRDLAAAREVGALLAARGVVVLCGGLGGVMQAVAEGAASHGGVSIGFLPGPDRSAGNAFLTYAFSTGLGQARNLVLANSCDAMIAIGGGWGTLSEIALAMRHGKPVVVLDGWEFASPQPGDGNEPIRVASPPDAVDQALELAG